MPFRTMDFESIAYAIPPLRQRLNDNHRNRCQPGIIGRPWTPPDAGS